MSRSDEKLRQLERTTSRAWPSFEETVIDGCAKRANSVKPYFGSSLPQAAKIATCEVSYRERRLPTIFRLTPFSQPEDLDDRLAALGYETLDPTLFMTCSLDDMSGGETSSEFIVSSEEWYLAFDGLRKLEAFERSSHRKIVESSDGERCFAAISADNEPRACGLGVFVDEAIGLFDLITHESRRGQGHGSSIVRSILGWACQRDARTVFLQVHSQNATARRFYERFGFEVAYPYWYHIKT